MPTGVAVDARKAVMRVTALDETPDRALLHRAMEPTRFAKLPAVALHALP